MAILEYLDPQTLAVLKRIEKKGEKFYIKRKDGSEKLIKVWRISFDKGLFLHSLILQNKLKNILELGTSIGYSTLFLADAAKKVKGHVTSFEIMNEKVNLATNNLIDAGLKNYAEVVGRNILDIIPEYKQKIDFLFIDANKKQYVIYYNFFKKNLNSNGIIFADNINKKTTKPFLKAVKKDLGSYLQEYEINRKEDYCLIRKI